MKQQAASLSLQVLHLVSTQDLKVLCLRWTPLLHLHPDLQQNRAFRRLGPPSQDSRTLPMYRGKLSKLNVSLNLDVQSKTKLPKHATLSKTSYLPFAASTF